VAPVDNNGLEPLEGLRWQREWAVDAREFAKERAETAAEMRRVVAVMRKDAEAARERAARLRAQAAELRIRVASSDEPRRAGPHRRPTRRHGGAQRGPGRSGRRYHHSTRLKDPVRPRHAEAR